jgi:uncharacterized protein YkwD
VVAAALIAMAHGGALQGREAQPDPPPVAADTFFSDLRLFAFAEAVRAAQFADTLRLIAFADAVRSQQEASALRAIAFARAVAGNAVGPPPAAAKSERQAAPPPPARGISADAAFTAAVFAAMNEHRAASGLPPVSHDPRLAAAASSYAQTMLRLNRFGHSVDGTTFDGRIRAAGFTANVVMGEIIAMSSGGAPTPEKIVQMWMDSPPHREQILSATFRLAGAACAFAGSEVRCAVEFAG